MRKVRLKQPVFFILMGVPGSGKTYLARQLAKTFKAAHVSAERIRHELLEKPSFSHEEEEAVRNMMFLLSEQFLNNDMSVIFDTSASTKAARRQLHQFACKLKAKPLTIWQQIDSRSAWVRCQNRKRSQSVDDKFASELEEAVFEQFVAALEEPVTEEVIVISGKHSFSGQLQTVLRHLLEMQLLTTSQISDKVIPKPGMINLVSASRGRVDYSRRNISIG